MKISPSKNPLYGMYTALKYTTPTFVTEVFRLLYLQVF